MSVAFFVDVLEKLLTRQIAASFDDAGQSGVVDIGFVAQAMLPLKAQMDMAAVDPDMLIA